MSFGGPVAPHVKDDLLVQAVEKAVKAGLTVVIAAGNAGPRRRTIESPGISPPRSPSEPSMTAGR